MFLLFLKSIISFKSLFWISIISAFSNIDFYMAVPRARAARLKTHLSSTLDTMNP